MLQEYKRHDTHSLQFNKINFSNLKEILIIFYLKILKTQTVHSYYPHSVILHCVLNPLRIFVSITNLIYCIQSACIVLQSLS